MMEFKIKNKKIGGDHPVFLVAELSALHKKDIALALKTVIAAKESGADAVKLQSYTPDTITLKSDNKYFRINQGTCWDGRTLYDLYKEAYMPWEWVPRLKKLAHDLGLICFSSPFDRTAVDMLKKNNMPAYKVASFEITDIPLIKYIAAQGKPVIISTGVAELKDIREAVAACRSVGNRRIALLKCTSVYPAPLEEMNLKTIPDLADKFKVVSGLSDHTLSINVPVAAAALGAKIIEKHFILNRKSGGPDAGFSLEPAEFKAMARAVRETEKSLGEVNYKLSAKTKKSREFCRSLFVAEDMKKGERFNGSNTRSIRPGFGLPPKDIKNIIGKRSKAGIAKGTPLNWRLIER